jgi:hypothetical protein
VRALEFEPMAEITITTPQGPYHGLHGIYGLYMSEAL